MTEISISRLITGLRKAGWSNDKIIDFLLYLGSGDEQYAPKEKG